jgi:hypothetical protein
MYSICKRIPKLLEKRPCPQRLEELNIQGVHEVHDDNEEKRNEPFPEYMRANTFQHRP